MRLTIPDPRTVPDLMARGGAAAETIMGLVPRAVGLLDAAEDLIDRVDALVARIETTREAADVVVERTDAVVSDANALIVRTAGTVASVEPTVAKGEALLSMLGPPLETLQPTLEKLAETTSPAEVEAMVSLVDQLPHLVMVLDRDILPIMASLGSVAPDIHELLDVTRELNEMLAKVPGMGIVRRRAAEDD
ncbi:hypothetical protein ACHAAC_00170 [Aeromicrobium sp. CF4.19]|uniref:hypothetical protein n=1 Tax=Aeromicrobium sp. CF4.19 TaxID=3373082 RepID=UPI003EE5FF28